MEKLRRFLSLFVDVKLEEKRLVGGACVDDARKGVRGVVGNLGCGHNSVRAAVNRP